MEYGIQMYSIRDITDKDMEGALRQVAEIGYKKVEFAGFMGHEAATIRNWLDKYGLEVSGTHTGWGEVAFDFENTVKYHKEIGNKNIIVPGLDLSTQQKLDDFINFNNEFGSKLAKEGITLGYHNHSHEFIPTEYGKIIHHELEVNTKVEFEIDTFWAFNAGEDPIATLERLKDRIRVIHIKDGFKGGKGMPLGRGEAPVADVYKKAKELGLLMVVESESLDPDGITEAKICFDFLKSQE